MLGNDIINNSNLQIQLCKEGQMFQLSYHYERSLSLASQLFCFFLITFKLQYQATIITQTTFIT